jgi:hypothetical protein
MNINHNDTFAVPVSTDLDAAIELLTDKGGYERADLAPLPTWLHRGDDVLVFELHDLSVMGSGRYPLYWAMPWERTDLTPRHAPDTTVCGLGWRYLPAMRVTVETADV